MYICNKMITVQDKIIDVKRFPDGTQMLLDFEVDVLYRPTPIKIVWCYESEDEALTLLYIKKHLENNYKAGYKANIELYMPYVPNGRMDRVKSDKEIFTLKHFCWFINSLGFDKVYIMDPHSIVSEALIDNVCVLRPSNIISIVIDKMLCLNDFEREVVIYFPDDGAYKRYKDLPCFIGLKCVYGKKERDWKTGQIIGIKVCDANGEVLPPHMLDNVDVLMVDDIISYGGTLAYSADKLKELGAIKICAYATHVEDSAINTDKGTLLKRINSGVVDFVYTTNSLFHEEHPNFVIIHKF